MDKVKVIEVSEPSREAEVISDTMVLPTCGIGFDNPNTPFYDTGGYVQDCTYPQAFHSHFLREEPVEKEYRRVVLENEYLRVEFAPDLGGRVWSIYDKALGFDVVHRNDCVKPYPGGFGGTYCAGGIELDYPFAHSVTNMWPRKTEHRENEDGSATYTVSEWERNGRTLWAMSFTLAPGEARLRQRVMLYNRSKFPASYMYWGNAGVPAHPGTRWIFKERMGSEHGGDTIFTWPEFVGLDLSWFRNNPEVLGLYFLDPQYDFFGAIDVETKTGLAHYADRHDLPGKKVWTWGQSKAAENRKWHLGLDPKPYGETQSGRPVNQEHFEWLMPEEYLSWEEYWAPVQGLTDITEMTEDCAFQFLPDQGRILCCAFAPVKKHRLRVLAEGQLLGEFDYSSDPCELQEIVLPDSAIEHPDRVVVQVVRNSEIIGMISPTNRCELKNANEIREEPILDECSSMACLATAEFNEKLLYRKKAAHYYKKAIELDRLNYRAYTNLGRMLLRHGDLDAAENNLRKAIDSYKWDTEAYLMLSHVHHLRGNVDQAMESAFAARYYGEKCRANVKLGELNILCRKYKTALRYLGEALCNNKMSLRTYALKSVCHRKLGDLEKAASCLLEAPDIHLKDLIWYTESWFLGRITRSELEKELFFDEWRFVELGLNYLEIGLCEEAEMIADVGIGLHSSGWTLSSQYNPDRIWGFSRERENPFLHMLKGFAAARAGREAEARESFARGDYFEYYVNSSAAEMEYVLRTAIDYGNAHAHHYLGNYLYHGMRVDEAESHWRALEETGAKCPQNTRNLAVYARHVEENATKARDLLRHALAMNPDDLFMRQELVDVERSCGASPEAVLATYLHAPQMQRDTFLMTRGLLAAYQQAGKWEEAADYLLQVDRRHVDEGATWYEFCLSYAEALIDAEKPQSALDWIAKSRPNPKNLTYVNYTDSYFWFHRQYYLTGLAHRMLGNRAEAEGCFRRAMEQPADSYYFRTYENVTYLCRFYVALAMKELGLDAAARGMLGGINKYRESLALVALRLERSELKRWSAKDPNSRVVVRQHTGPEI